MAARTTALKFKRSVGVSPPEAYRAFLHGTALRDWLADAAEVDPHPGGHLYLWWNSGYSASGRFTALEPGRKVAFTWQGSGSQATGIAERSTPTPTRVQVTLRATSDGTAITLTHSGLGTGKTWTQAREQIAAGWEAALENLQSVLERGIDLRLARMPRLGILIGEFSPAVATQLGVPVTRGIRLEGTAEGSGAQAAGLQKDDVLVKLAGKAILDFPSLSRALAGRQAGDTVPVVFYRGGDRRTVRMALSSRPPPPEVPETAAELANVALRLYMEGFSQLSSQVGEVGEAQAEIRPAPNEWNLKELVAHFILCERDLQSWIADMVNDNTVGDSLEFRPNVTPRLQAVVARFQTIPALLEELKLASAETVALLAGLPPELVARRHLYRRIAQWVLFVAPSHLREEHRDQLAADLETARNAGANP